MNYLIFDNDVYYDLDGKTGIAPKHDIQAVFKGSTMEAVGCGNRHPAETGSCPGKISLPRRDEVLSRLLQANI